MIQERLYQYKFQKFYLDMMRQYKFITNSYSLIPIIQIFIKSKVNIQKIQSKRNKYDEEIYNYNPALHSNLSYMNYLIGKFYNNSKNAYFKLQNLQIQKRLTNKVHSLYLQYEVIQLRITFHQLQYVKMQRLDRYSSVCKQIFTSAVHKTNPQSFSLQLQLLQIVFLYYNQAQSNLSSYFKQQKIRNLILYRLINYHVITIILDYLFQNKFQLRSRVQNIYSNDPLQHPELSSSSVFEAGSETWSNGFTRMLLLSIYLKYIFQTSLILFSPTSWVSDNQKFNEIMI
ncbi:hypothetical protein pb186bvf_020517 [Paramecium bursaria]